MTSAITSRMRAGFLQRQFEDAMALAASSDLLDLMPVAGWPPEKYVAVFRCRGLVETAPGQIEVADEFAVGLWLHEGYQIAPDPIRVCTWLAPANIHHPNVTPVAGGVFCIGEIQPSTPLIELLYRTFDLIRWGRATLVEHNAFNHGACARARREWDGEPIDTRPLKWRAPTAAASPGEAAE